MANSIYAKQSQLEPSAMRAVADRRFADAEALRDTRSNAHANGAVYLAGFVIEILLKARLVQKYPGIAHKRQHEVPPEALDIWRLIWRQHDLEAMVSSLAELEAFLKKKSERDGLNYLEELKSICGTWTIQARYSSQTIRMDEASRFLASVRRLKEVLK